ncbi:outer membrane beta-barrel protein [Pedobacter xixiisoli]|uniref:Outer membrane receptor proteins, mostly Fe transport n=1 Tax=Pedobacter xixiisoli TaxID=1476464 RepID=A0A286A0H1_9SPHI|nr:outer membrane beta-barrel protein [Pedobacter xixiisoli]SOD15385.1 Outer membrane receptor proteins, mostly Fe transport [Pedobacter xixiisoli]
MKRIILIALIWCVCFTAFAQDKKFSLSQETLSLPSLFKKIQAQCGYTFVYSDEIVSDTMMVTVNANRLPVSEVLANVLPHRKLFYQMLSESMIVIGSENLLKQQDATAKSLLTGEVLENDGAVVPFATVTLFQDTTQINGAIANEKGEFQFYQSLRVGAAYLLKVSSMGFETAQVSFFPTEQNRSSKAFGKIKLKHKARVLKEVNISGAQKVIEMDGSNIVFNVSKSLTAQGTNALELLSRAPGVTVGTDNNIALNGKGGAAVLIDGKQTYLSNREIAELLKSMSASEIKSIEIMNSPSAKYDAAGTAGVINVKTLKSTMQGFSAGFTTGLSYGAYLRNNQDLFFNYRKNRLNVFGNYSHFIGYYSYLYGADRIQEGKFYDSFTDDVDKRNKMGSRLGADFAIDKKNTVGILLNGNFIFGGGITDTQTDIGVAQSNQIDQTLSAINDYYQQQTQRYNVNLNYKYEDTLGNIINFDADYGDFTKGAGNLQTNKYTASNGTVLSDNLYRSLNAIDIGLRAVKADYTTKLWKGKLETGLKFSSVSADNDSKFLEVKPEGEFRDPDRSNRFVYQEEIANAYVNYQKTFGKWQLQGGLRVENTASKGELDEISVVAGNMKVTERNYTNWFPFFSAAIKPSAHHNFSLSYSKRIDRPAYQNLNPFIYLLDELSYWQGNPFLAPQISHRLLLQYAYKSSTIIGLSYTHTNNFSVEVTDVVDDTKIVMVPRNLGTQQHLALTLTQTLSPAKWWNVIFNGTLFGLHNDIDFGGGRKLDLKQLAGRMNLQQTFKLPYGFNAEVVGIYNSRKLAGANQFPRATGQIDLGLQRNLMNDKATLRLIFADIYKGTKAYSVQSVDGLYIRNYSYFETSQVRLNFSYRFSSGNSKGPRTRSSALENEQGRIK